MSYQKIIIRPLFTEKMSRLEETENSAQLKIGIVDRVGTILETCSKEFCSEFLSTVNFM